MAWNIASLDRRTRDAAVEAARRAGMRLDDWLDEVITDYAGLDQHARPEHNGAEDDRLDAAAGRLERIARRNERAQAQRAPRSLETFNSAIERFEMRLARAEAQAARAFETVAQILGRDNAARDSDRRALIDAVRRLESIRTNSTDAARTGETRGDRFPPTTLDPKPSFDLKAAVSQIAMRRHELETHAGRSETGPTPPDPRTAGFDADASAPSLAERHPDIAQAAVVPIDDDIKGQKPVAFVIKKPGRSLDGAAVKRFALANAPAYQHPRFVWFVDELPLASTNKLDRAALLQMVRERMASGE